MIVCGIDEAGRGPLAGPLCFAGCIMTVEIDGLNDSKKLTERRREELFELITQSCRFHIVWHSAQQIDYLGISACIKNSLLQIKESLSAQEYIFDGNSRFGVEGLRTLIKADQTVPQVMAASIIAKVSRDREMIKLHEKYPLYDFANNKGYGTAKHVEMIERYGLCEEHRRSFKLKSLQPTLF